MKDTYLIETPERTAQGILNRRLSVTPGLGAVHGARHAGVLKRGAVVGWHSAMTLAGGTFELQVPTSTAAQGPRKIKRCFISGKKCKRQTDTGMVRSGALTHTWTGHLGGHLLCCR